MSSRKRPSLHRNITRASGATRQSVSIEGRCSVGAREAQDVVITDLGSSGCRIRPAAVGITKSETVELMLGDVGPLRGRIAWSKGGALGVLFEEPLAQGVIDALDREWPTSNVVPLRG